MRSRSERISRAIVRLYPRAWRERYGAELLALIDDTGSSWKHAFDLAAGCADAWFRAAFSVSDNYSMEWLRGFIGAVLVRVVTATATYFSVIPPQSLRVVLHGVFWLLAILLYGTVFYMTLFAFAKGFQRAWRQWFGMIHGRQPEVVIPVASVAELNPAPRQLKALTAVILVAAIGADFTDIDPAVSRFLGWTVPPMIPWITYWMLAQIRMFAFALNVLAIGRRRAKSLN